jgi:hypothetical protein
MPWLLAFNHTHLPKLSPIDERKLVIANADLEFLANTNKELN